MRFLFFTVSFVLVLNANSDFENMVKTYANTQIEYPSLKPVTLAMMMLESGRGTSRLAIEHKNFAGLKYRKQIGNYAYKVRYKASDGYDDYSAFKSHEDFIKGFWAFLDRSPYEGWRKSAYSPEAFLKKISPAYCPFNKNYVRQVMNLLPEAESLLAKHSKIFIAQKNQNHPKEYHFVLLD